MKCLMTDADRIDDYFELDNPVEYRSWSTNHRGDIFLGINETKQSNPFIWAVASLDDVSFDAEQNIYEFHISNVRSIMPLPVKVQPRLFDVETGEPAPLDVYNGEEFEAAYAEANKWIAKKKTQPQKRKSY